MTSDSLFTEPPVSGPASPNRILTRYAPSRRPPRARGNSVVPAIRRRCEAILVATVVAFIVVGGPAGAFVKPTYPVNWNVLSAMATGIAQPGVPPPGANIPGCRPSFEHPYPVVLVHGTFGNQNDYWQAVAPTLANAGYCVYTLTYGQTWYSGGIGGLESLYTSAQQLATFVGTVLTTTGASQVDIVGHSQGGLLPRLYMKYYGGARYVRDFVALAPPNNAPPAAGGIAELASLFPPALAIVGLGCLACQEMLDPSLYITLNHGGETYPRVRYTVIISTDDEVVTPPAADSYLPAKPNVTNESVQSLCPSDHVGHLGEMYDPDVVQMVLNALSPAQAQPVSCSSGFPY
jgi:pimeloyl-ACP methyl ester carboxylesterase